MQVKSEASILSRLKAWRELFGEPLNNGRSNPDNDMWFLLLDAEECIEGLRRYAKSLEKEGPNPNGLSHAELCELSRILNQSRIDIGTPAYRINEWLKRQIQVETGEAKPVSVRLWRLPSVETVLDEMLAVATSSEDDETDWMPDQRAAVDLWQAAIRSALVTGHHTE